MYMGKTTKIVMMIIVMLVAAAVIIYLVSTMGTSSKSNLTISSSQDLENLVNQIYEGVETFPSVATMSVDITDKEAVTYSTGITSTDKIDFAVVSEPMMSSQAYSMVLVKVKSSKDADTIAKEMNDNINPDKWICVSADKVYTTSSGDVICLVMASEEMAKPVYDKFKTLAGEIGKEYVRDNNQGFVE